MNSKPIQTASIQSSQCSIIDLGLRDYQEILELQRSLCRARIVGRECRDLLLLVEHPPVVTLGRGTKSTSLPIPPEQLTSHGFEVIEVERGGDVTIHEPGQLVGYPIIDLNHHRRDLHWYLRQLEEVLIRALAALDISAARNPGLTGVWTQGRKIASIGIHVKQWVTYHGFALNVVNDLTGFERVVPCGISGVTMTSVLRELPSPRQEHLSAVWKMAKSAVIDAMGEVFELTPVVVPESSLTVR